MERVCRHGLHDLLQRLRGPSARGILDWPSEGSLREDAFGLDSLELLEAVADANRRFGLHVTGIEDHLLISPNLSAWGAAVARHYAYLGCAAEITFRTSGSTGTPKSIEHERSALDREIGALQQTLWPDRSGTFLDPSPMVVAMVPAHHIFGFLFTVLLPSCAEWRVRDHFGRAPGTIWRDMKPGDVVVATPHLLDLALSSSPAIPDGCEAILSGAPVPDGLWTRARTCGLALTEIYGATETGGVGWRRHRQEPFRLLCHLERDGEVVRDAVTGMVAPIQDRLEWADARHFRILGRLDEVVQVGGVNVSPRKVADVLRKDEAVAEAVIRLDGDTGRLKAFVVPMDEEASIDLLEERLRAHVAKALPAPARPQSYTFGPAVPRTPGGKFADWQSRML